MFKPAIANFLAQAAVEVDPDTRSAWLVAGAIVVLGLVVFGLKDLLRFRPRRVRALASVCFRESVRRRVLWITPLAIVAVIIVSQLQRPLDEQDAIRQTLKFCLFATGALVAVTGVILACTNLPKEIESRVIYTIVTKPTTRLEVVLGKIAGFAAVSGTILLIMGVFTFVYLHGRAWSFMSDVDARLANLSPSDQGTAETLRHYKTSGLLTAETLNRASDLQVYSRPSKPDAKVHYMAGGGQGDFLVPFQIAVPELVPQANLAGAAIQLYMGYEPGPASHDAAGNASTEETEGANGPKILAPHAATQPSRLPRTVSIEILDANLNSFIQPNSINNGAPVRLLDPTGKQPVIIPIAPAAAVELLKGAPAFVRVMGDNRNTDYIVSEDPVQILYPGATPQQVTIFPPLPDTTQAAVKRWPHFRARSTTGDEQQIRGSELDAPPSPDRPLVAVYRFRDAAVSTSGDDAAFEIKGRIERSGEESDMETPTYLQVVSVPLNGEPSQPITIQPESNRVSYFKIPKAAIGNGNFDLQVRCITRGHFVNLSDRSLSVVTANQPFAVNLLKSLAVLWLLAILVVVISIFCSTFLSWPIAIVLTIVILLGHWGVQQLGDVLAPGIGNSVVTDMFGSKVDPNVAKTVSSSVEKLAQGLNLLSIILPDITRFSAIEDIERGLTVPAARLIESIKVLLMFGLPMIVLSYVFLKNKEVAP